MRFWLVILLVWASWQSNGEESIRVRLFSDKTVSSTQIRIMAGHYAWVAVTSDGKYVDTIADASPLRKWLFDIRPTDNELAINHGALSLGRYPIIKLIPTTDSAWFLIKGSGPERVYEGALEIRKSGSSLTLINEVGLHSYIAGVVESEGGHSTEFEYYRAQAVLARTWLVANWNKHIRDGYNVKDDVSSQAYFSMAYLQNSARIREAVSMTGDSILVDANSVPVLGVFHANSGGQTSNSEDVWSNPVSYLRSVPDSFSLAGEKAFWEKTIDKEAFVSYVANKMGVSPRDATFRVALLEYRPVGREGYFRYGNKSMKWRDVRAHFNLRSAWFSVHDNGGTVTLKGRGFGHGVGMSQEGAMVMSQRGYHFHEILEFYFSGTHVLSLTDYRN